MNKWIIELIFAILVIFGVFSYLNYEKKQCIENGGKIARTYGRNYGFTCIPKGSDK